MYRVAPYRTIFIVIDFRAHNFPTLRSSSYSTDTPQYLCEMRGNISVRLAVVNALDKLNNTIHDFVSNNKLQHHN